MWLCTRTHGPIKLMLINMLIIQVFFKCAVFRSKIKLVGEHIVI